MTIPQLSTQQEAAVRHKNGHALVTACPGSGKTTTIVGRILHLLDSGVAPERIVACAFTVNSARELRKRLAADPRGMDRARSVRIGTIHGVALAHIRKHGSMLDFRDAEHLRVRSEDEAKAYYDMALAALAFKPKDASQKRVLAVVGKRVGAYDVTVTTKERMIVDKYERLLKEHNSVVFDQIVPMATEIVARGVTLGCDKFIVDEAQDLSGDQWAFAKEAGLNANLFIVGDVDQAIYEWRGAKPEMFVAFSQRAGVKVYPLGENYRSTADICAHASQLIDHNSVRVNREPMVAIGDLRLPVHVADCDNENEEAVKIASDPIFAVFDRTRAILAPTHARLDLVELELKKRGIACERLARRPLDPLAVGAVEFLRLLANPHDDFLAERAVNWPAVRLPDSDLHKVAARAAERNETLVATLLTPHMQAVYPAPGRWARLIAEIRHDHFESGVLDDAQDVYARMVAGMSLGAHAGRLRELHAAIGDWCVMTSAAGLRADLGRFVDDLEAGQVRLDVPDIDPAAVALTTIHGAKGLEWDHVVVLGHEEGTLPRRSGENVDEDRRTAYVAWTRARRTLVLTSCAEVTGFSGRPRKVERSRFLDEGARAALKEATA